MKSIGIVRSIDTLGRIVLPVELRKQFDIEPRDDIEIYTEGNRIILKKYEPSCIFCSGTEELKEYNGKTVCAECIKRMSEID